MRAPSDMPRRARRRDPGRGRVVLIVAAVVLFLLATSLRGIARFYTDELWFSSLDQDEVFWGVLRTKVGLALAFSTLFALLLWVNLAVAHRLAPTNRSFGPGDELLSRYQDVVDRRGGIVRVGFSVVFGLVAGVGVSSQWREWLLFSNSKSFDQVDPLFGLDIGFYVFQLPFLSTVVATLFASVTVILLITIVAHYLNGGIDLNAPVQRVAPAVKAHVSVLLGLLALIKAADYWLSRYELTLSTRGYVNGAGYTDVEAQLPALDLLFVIALLSAALFIWNIRRRGWVLPAVAVGLWALVAIVAGTAYPEFIQRFQVEPAESQREAPYIEDNIAATREALGIQAVDTQEFEYQADLPASELLDNEDTVRNIRLLDPNEVLETYNQIQRTQSYYGFGEAASPTPPNALDIDRYMIENEAGDLVETQVVLGSRNLLPQAVPQKSWENSHLAYTHGYGVALSPANAVTAEQVPDFLVGDVPVSESPSVPLGLDGPNAKPQIYFGEGFEGYAIVNTDRTEVDYQDESGEDVSTEYTGKGGVSMGSFVKRAAFALRFGDINPLISDLVTADSRIIFERDVRARVEALAPFLTWDADVYPVVIDGRISYIVDGYTTTPNYPYAQRVDLTDTADLPAGSGLSGVPFNYVRNSVKAVIDAYDGTVTMYVVDNDDPVIKAWDAAFPSLFTPGNEADGTELEKHFRYPQELFRVQTSMYGQYRVTDPNQFYGRQNVWSVAQDPGRRVFTEGEVANTTPVTNAQGIQEGTRTNRVHPYYVQMSLPDQDNEQFILLRTFAPVSNTDRNAAQNLTAFMVAGSDPDEYGKLTVYEMPNGTQVEGPSQVASQMESDEEISRRISLINTEGTSVIFGDLLLIPIEESILYVRPVYLQRDANAFPLLVNVIVDKGTGKPVMRATLKSALLALYPGDLDLAQRLTTLEEDRPESTPENTGNDGTEPTDTTSTSTTSTTTPSTTTTTAIPPDDQLDTVEELLLAAEAKFDQADQVLRDQGAAGLEEYLALVREAQDYLRRALDLGTAQAEVPTGESTTTTAPAAETTTTVPGG